eukprot:m.463246 g.463246  ORF g.463246 m.463246 type:complete len:167 (-) comp57031_c0_seq4:878-1378(-)
MVSRGEMWSELQGFLLGDRFPDMPPFPHFAELFPPQYRDSPYVRTMYRALKHRRANIRSDIEQNIKQFVTHIDSVIDFTEIDNPLANMNDMNLQTAIERLQQKAEDSEEELRLIDLEYARLQKSLKAIDQSLDRIDLTDAANLCNQALVQEAIAAVEGVAPDAEPI